MLGILICGSFACLSNYASTAKINSVSAENLSLSESYLPTQAYFFDENNFVTNSGTSSPNDNLTNGIDGLTDQATHGFDATYNEDLATFSNSSGGV